MLSIVLSIVGIFVQFPLTLGVAQLGLDAATNRESDWTKIFLYYGLPGFVLKVFVATALSSILVSIGLVFFIIPGIYLAVSYILVIPLLLINPDIGIWQALEESRKRVHSSWFQGLGLCLVKILLALSCLLIIPIFWAIPLIVTMDPVIAVFATSKDVFSHTEDSAPAP